MKKFNICNQHSGVDMGTFDGETESDALDAMARDAGYSDYAEACKVAPAAEGEIIVTKIDE